MKKYLGWAIIAFVIFYLLSSPANAAHLVDQGVGGLATLGNQLKTFISAL